MEWKRFLCYFLLCLTLVSAIRRSRFKWRTLHDLNDLKNIDYAKRFPRHGLMLLYWFANNGNLDQNMRFRLNFDPSRGDYGSHRYRNHERLLDDLDDNSNSLSIVDRAYYTVGNLNQLHVRTQFPPYVTEQFGRNLISNLDRIIIRVSENNPTIAEEVYITQHYETRDQGSGYDPNNTFLISNTLLRQIQELTRPRTSVDEQDRENFDNAVNMYNNRGLALFLSLIGYDLQNSYNVFERSWQCSQRHKRAIEDVHTRCDVNSDVQLKVKPTDNGYAKMTWSHVPENIIDSNGYVCLISSGTVLSSHRLSDKTGSKDTNIYLNPGLQVSLRLWQYFYWTAVWHGPEFDEANGKLPTEISDHDASLQLYTKDGYACVRLYIKKSWTEWKDTFYYSWVGLYSHKYDTNEEYETYQWAVKFKSLDPDANENYNIYKYESSMSIKPGAQARFFIKGYDATAYTESWD